MSARAEDRRAAPGAGDAGRRFAWPGDPEGIAAADIDFEALAACTGQHLPLRRAHPAVPLARGACGDRQRGDRGARRAGPATGRRLALHALIEDAPSAWLRGEPSSSQRATKLAAAIKGAVRAAAGLDPVLEEGDAELLRFVARMTAAAERRDLDDTDASPGTASRRSGGASARSAPAGPRRSGSPGSGRFRGRSGTNGRRKDNSGRTKMPAGIQAKQGTGATDRAAGREAA